MKNYKLPSDYRKEALKNLEEKARIYTQGARKRKKNEEVKDIKNKLREIRNKYGNLRIKSLDLSIHYYLRSL